MKQFFTVWISPLHSAITLSSSMSMVSWCDTGQIVILLQADLILENIIIKFKMLTDCRILTDTTDNTSLIAVSVSSSIHTLSRSAWSCMLGQTIFTLAWATASITFCSSIAIILFRVNNISYRCPVSIWYSLADLRSWFTVVEILLIWSCTVLLIFTCLLFAFISWTTNHYLQRWWMLNESSRSRKCATSTLKSCWMCD